MDSLVINNPNGDLLDNEKFLLLQQSVEDTPRELIKNIPVTGANFLRASKTLQDCYDDTNKLKAEYHITPSPV